MNATAAVRGLFPTPRAGPILRVHAPEHDALFRDWHRRAEDVRDILLRDGSSISYLSVATRKRFGTGSPYFIPSTMLYKLRRGITPHVCQIAALSEHTGYRFSDWLQLFGFDLRQIPRLQMQLHTERTTLVTPVEDESPFLRAHSDFEAPHRAAHFRGFRETGCDRGRYLFAQVGANDAPGAMLSAGSVVRFERFSAEVCHERSIRNSVYTGGGNLLWLVELVPGGLTCCQIRWIDQQQIVLQPHPSSWGCWPLRVPTEARILGWADTGHPSLPSTPQPPIGSLPLPPLLPVASRGKGKKKMNVPDVLRAARARTGLTFRSAHRLTRCVAKILGHQEYAIALGLLSDYEALGRLPRHTAKILSLCITYCIDVWELLQAAGVHIDDSAKLSLPFPDRLHFPAEFTDSALHETAVS